MTVPSPMQFVTPARPRRFRMLKPALLGLLALITLLAIVVAMQPRDFKVERRATIAASPETVFALVDDFHRWEAWSPWEKLDPAMKKTFGGSDSGVGATYAWEGNSDVGEGRMTLTDRKPHEHIYVRLEFFKPFAATNMTQFAFAPHAGGTEVAWSMTGERNFLMKAMCLVMDMDKMIGGDFEKGLARMKVAAESR